MLLARSKHDGNIIWKMFQTNRRTYEHTGRQKFGELNTSNSVVEATVI